MFETVLIISLVLFSVVIVGAVYRAIKGPSMPDRVLALDMVGINMIAMTAVFSILLHTYAFFEVILLLGILSFIGTIAFARFIERGAVIERERNK